MLASRSSLQAGEWRNQLGTGNNKKPKKLWQCKYEGRPRAWRWTRILDKSELEWRAPGNARWLVRTAWSKRLNTLNMWCCHWPACKSLIPLFPPNWQLRLWHSMHLSCHGPILYAFCCQEPWIQHQIRWIRVFHFSFQVFSYLSV